MHPSSIIINIKTFQDNLNYIRQTLSENVKICLPVKANAYGHGIKGISKLAELFVDYFAVACLNEGALLRKTGIEKPILVLGAIDEDQIPGLIENNLDITISSFFKAKLVSDFCKRIGKSCKVHIKVDTGMNRVGIKAKNAASLIDYIHSDHNLELEGIYSHLAESEEIDRTFTTSQIESFRKVCSYAKSKKEDIICHLANSGALCYSPESYLDMVRPGILSYGYFPGKKEPQYPLNQVKPSFMLKTKIAYFKAIEAGESVSYNRKYRTDKLTRIVTLPIGYGDGYRRALSGKGTVLIRGHKYPISGTICMDMTMVDIGSEGTAYVGDEAVLIGSQGKEQITLEEIADICQTNTYEILCSLSERIPRIYA
ncbi:MAG TPA: alanine racemase [Lentisphaeria bacterium]|nr:MAG: alanine racemase [Lentisphaerae bacterium GWF2_38_69]HBM16338.1 alanine racemase [Lentisphaeria bacterium]